MDRTVCVAIVTYNRKEYLENLLKKILELDYPIQGLVIIDNYSQDGTEKRMIDLGVIKDTSVNEISLSIWNNIKVYYYRNGHNSGGSGGFAKAFEIVQNLPYDCIWAMDDDVEPEHDCLSKMMRYLDSDSRMVIPCRSDENFIDYATQEYNLKNIRYFHINQCKRNRVEGTSLSEDFVYVEDMAFEGPLMLRSLIDEIGIPNKDYFIFYDDTDYAHRALSRTKIRYIRDARLHKKIIPKEGNTWSWKSYYNFRNSVYFEKKYGENWGVRHLRPLLRLMDLIIRAICKRNYYRIKWLVRGYRDGINGKMGKTYEISDIPNK